MWRQSFEMTNKRLICNLAILKKGVEYFCTDFFKLTKRKTSLFFHCIFWELDAHKHMHSSLWMHTRKTLPLCASASKRTSPAYNWKNTSVTRHPLYVHLDKIATYTRTTSIATWMQCQEEAESISQMITAQKIIVSTKPNTNHQLLGMFISRLITYMCSNNKVFLAT